MIIPIKPSLKYYMILAGFWWRCEDGVKFIMACVIRLSARRPTYWKKRELQKLEFFFWDCDPELTMRYFCHIWPPVFGIDVIGQQETKIILLGTKYGFLNTRFPTKVLIFRLRRRPLPIIVFDRNNMRYS